MSTEAAKRATIVMADQCVASVSNFGVGIGVARITGVAGFGAFSLAYACWILLTTLHRSLVTDPMAIFGDMRQQGRDEFVRQGIAAEVVLGLSASIVIAALGAVLFVTGQHEFGEGLLAVAPWMTVLDVQDYWRWIGFMQEKPGKSLRNDLMFNVVQLAGFAIVVLDGQRSVFAVVAVWGSGAAVATLYGFLQFSIRPTFRGGVTFLRLRLATSKWLAGERAASWGAGQIYLILAGALLGPTAFGGLKAAQALVSGPSSVLIHAGGSYGLPEASRRFAERGWDGLVRVSRFVMGAGMLSTVVCAIAVMAAGGTLLRILYGPAFAVYAPSAQLFAISYIISAFGIGPVLVLNVTARTRPLLVVQLAKLATSVPAVAVLAAVDGASGAAWAAVASAVAAVATLQPFQSAARRSVRDSALVPAGVQLGHERSA